MLLEHALHTTIHEKNYSNLLKTDVDETVTIHDFY